MRLRPLLGLLLASLTTHAAEIKGKVTNAVGGEPLQRVEVLVVESKAMTQTSGTGEFDIPNVAPGAYTLRLNAVGFRLVTIPFTVASSDVKDFSVTLVPDNFHHTDKVEVHADVFQVSDSPATTEENLTASEIRETSTVFADDPFRAVQTLPGVAAEGNDEFFAEFSVFGAPFESVSIYIDDVLVPNPFHEIGHFADGASLGVLTSEVVEEMKLMPAAYPEKFGDADGAALDVRTREGSRGKPLVRISAGIAATEVLGEGGLGTNRKGSWLLSGRRSYINYLVHGLENSAPDVGFYDADARLSYDLTSRQNVNFFATGGHTTLSMSDPASLSNFLYASGSSDFTLSRVGWRFAVSPTLLVDARAAYLREPNQLRNNNNAVLTKDDHREWVGGSSLSWAWSKDQVFQAGWSERRLRDSEYQANFDTDGSSSSFSLVGTGWRQSGYLQQASSLLRGRLHVLGSLRWDSMTGFSIHPFSPQLSLAIKAARSTELQFGVGRYQQFSTSVEEGPICAPLGFMPEKSNHYTAAIEQRLGENTRVRLQVFDRQDSWALGFLDGFANSVAPPAPCPSFAPLPNSTYQRDYSRGAQFILQRRSANRLSGWLGYTLVQARQRGYQVPIPISPNTIFINTPYYPTLEDQRHTVNVFAMYRLRPTLNLSGKWLYGSGFPIPSGTFTLLGNGQYVETGINQTRLGNYLRLDARVDKDWVFQRWKLTLYGEVLNLTNHYNARYFYSSAVDPITGQVQIKTLQGLPLTPTAGVVFQF